MTLPAPYGDVDCYRGDPVSLRTEWRMPPAEGAPAGSGPLIDVSQSTFKGELRSNGRLLAAFDVDMLASTVGVVTFSLIAGTTSDWPEMVSFDIEESPRWGRTMLAGRLIMHGEVTTP